MGFLDILFGERKGTNHYKAAEYAIENSRGWRKIENYEGGYKLFQIRAGDELLQIRMTVYNYSCLHVQYTLGGSYETIGKYWPEDKNYIQSMLADIDKLIKSFESPPKLADSVLYEGIS